MGKTIRNFQKMLRKLKDNVKNEEVKTSNYWTKGGLNEKIIHISRGNS